MKTVKRWAVILLCIATLLSLFGCKGKDKFLVDGPGMVNDQPWKAFTLSHSASYAQYIFWFTVEQGDFAFLLTGECRDENDEYTIDDGVEISAADLRFLRDLRLDALSEEVSSDDDLLVMDAPNVSLVLTYMDGTQQKKAISSDTAIAIYNRFLPYFTSN